MIDLLCIIWWYVLWIFILNVFENEILFHLFYTTLILRTTFTIMLWIVNFGTKGFGVEWVYDGKEGMLYLPPIGE